MGNEKEIEFWFFAEDVSPLGSYYYRRKNNSPSLLLPFSNENIEILKAHREIKGLIFGIYAMSEYKMVLMYNNTKTLNQIEKMNTSKLRNQNLCLLNHKQLDMNY